MTHSRPRAQSTRDVPAVTAHRESSPPAAKTGPEAPALRIMVTGGRGMKDPHRVRAAFRRIHVERVLLIHGDQRGADRLAAQIAKDEFGWAIESYAADWTSYGFAAGPMRNQGMVDSKPNLCIAFPTKPKGTPHCGTWDAVRRARKALIPVLIG